MLRIGNVHSVECGTTQAQLRVITVVMVAENNK